MSYKMNSTINSAEAETLKKMIFDRARERAKSMTDDVQTDVMDIARESFVSNNNPFSQIANTLQNNTPTTKEINTDKKQEITGNYSQEEGIGFPQRKIQIQQANNIANEQSVINTINNNMLEARASLSSKSNFMGALNFLNAQSAVSLFRDNENNFNVVI